MRKERYGQNTIHKMMKEDNFCLFWKGASFVSISARRCFIIRTYVSSF